MTDPRSSVPPERPLRRPGRLGRALAVGAIALGLALAGVGLYEYAVVAYSGTTLIVYTYPSLLGGPGSPAFAAAFDGFASAHGIRIDVEYPSGTLVNTLLAQENAPVADLVIGLDELTAPVAEAHGLLVPYAPADLANVSPNLTAELSPDFGAIPFEYGYLAIDYGSAFFNATSGAVARATLPDLVSNATWAHQLVVENPTTDITGEEFLAWQVEYYEHVLHQNWTSFWTTAPTGTPTVVPDWGTAFNTYFLQPAGQNQLVVSYSTDPAYAAYAANGSALPFNATVSWWNGTPYGWSTIYGLGIVAGSRHLALDQEFERWFLSGAVQSTVPTNEWEYPANATVPLPSAFAWAIPPSTIVALNGYTTPSGLAASLPGWVATWAGLR